VKTETHYFKELQGIDKAMKSGYARAGIIAREVRDNLLWKEREGCTSFTRWIKMAAPYSYSHVNQALKDIEALKDIPDEHLKEIPPANLFELKKVSTAVRAEPEVIEAAKTLQPDDFIGKVNHDHPEQHLERSKTMKFNPSESDRATIEEALAMAERRGAVTRNDALLAVAIEAKAQWEREDELEALGEVLSRELSSDV
jgi:hypothetical protein